MKIKFPAVLRVIGRSFVDWWDSWLDLFVVVVVWVFAQITIILGPPATFGMYYVAYHLINGESLGVRGMIEGGKKYFGLSWLWAAINAFVLVVLFTNVRFYGSVQSQWGAYAQLFTLLVLLLWVTVQFYTLPYLMEMEKKHILKALRNAFFTSMASPFYSFLLLVVAVIVTGVCVALIIPTFFGLPAVIPLLGIQAMYNRLEAYGIRERERTPKEIEREQAGRINVPLREQNTGDKEEPKKEG
jgi:hypothetical protein